MKILVVGYGSIGKRHLNNLLTLEGIELGVLSHEPRKDIPSLVKTFSHLEDALKWAPQAAFICTPTAIHEEAAVPLLENGCAIYLEKPIAHSLESAQKISEAQKKSGAKVMVGYQYRYHPTLLKVKKLLEQGRIGKVKSVSAVVGEYLPLFHPEEDYRASYAAQKKLGGGVVLTLSHEIDYLLWLFGEPSEIRAEGGKLSDLEIDVEDTAHLRWLTPHSIPVTLQMDYLQNPPQRTLEIQGDRGKILWNYYQSLSLFNERNDKVEEFFLPKPWDRNDLFMAALQDFISYVSENKPSPVSMEEGLKVMRVACAALTKLSAPTATRNTL